MTILSSPFLSGYLNGYLLFRSEKNGHTPHPFPSPPPFILYVCTVSLEVENNQWFYVETCVLFCLFLSWYFVLVNVVDIVPRVDCPTRERRRNTRSTVLLWARGGRHGPKGPLVYTDDTYKGLRWIFGMRNQGKSNCSLELWNPLFSWHVRLIFYRSLPVWCFIGRTF